MDEKTREYLKEKGKEVRSQNRVFKKRIDQLFAKKYRYSLRYEDAMILDDGKAYINVDLTKVESPFSILSYDRRIDSEIYSYIDQQAFYLRAAIPIVINFDDGGKYSDDMKNKIKKAVVRHYSLEYEDKRLEWQKGLLFGCLIAGIGIVFLLIYILLSVLVFIPQGIDNIFIEILCIFSWVFVWQSLDYFIFRGHERRVDVYNAGQLALAEVSFGEPVTKK